MVGGMLMNLSSTLAPDAARLEAMPCRYISEPLSLYPPLVVASAAPEIMPSAIDAPKICEIVVVDLIFQAGLAHLIETVELVEIDGVPIRHQHPVEGDGEALLSEAGDLLRIAKNERAFRDKHMLAVLAVNGIGDHDLDRPGELAVEPIDQRGVDSCSLEEHKGLAVRGVDVHLRRALLPVRGSGLRSRSLCGKPLDERIVPDYRIRASRVGFRRWARSACHRRRRGWRQNGL